MIVCVCGDHRGIFINVIKINVNNNNYVLLHMLRTIELILDN